MAVRLRPVTTSSITAAHEAWQPPGAEEQWSDSFYFGGGDGRGLAFYSRIGRRQSEGDEEGRDRDEEGSEAHPARLYRRRPDTRP